MLHGSMDLLMLFNGGVNLLSVHLSSMSLSCMLKHGVLRSMVLSCSMFLSGVFHSRMDGLVVLERRLLGGVFCLNVLNGGMHRARVQYVSVDVRVGMHWQVVVWNWLIHWMVSAESKTVRSQDVSLWCCHL